MGGGRSAYNLVLAALPRHGRLTAARRPPVSRLVLDRRLRLLPQRDQEELARIEAVLAWDQAQKIPDDAAAMARMQEVVASLRSPFLRDLLNDRIGMRAIVAAFRRRVRGETEAGPELALAGERRAWRIRRRRSASDFGLGGAEPWVRRVAGHVDQHDVLGMDREVAGEVWRRLERARARRPSGYEALVIYVLQWSLVDRQTRHDAEKARVRLGEWSAVLAGAPLPWEGATA